ncbi:MAG: hypothetical protein ACK5Y2_13785 [Bdellovibrionales bacterium]
MNKMALALIVALAAQGAMAQRATNANRTTEVPRQRENRGAVQTGISAVDQQAQINRVLEVASRDLGITNSNLRSMLEQNTALGEAIMDAAALAKKSNRTKSEDNYLNGLQTILEVYGSNRISNPTAKEAVEIKAARRIVSELAGRFNEYGSPAKMAEFIEQIGSIMTTGKQPLNIAVVQAAKKVYELKNSKEVEKFLEDVINCRG